MTSARTFVVAPGRTSQQGLSLSASHGWYDFVVTSDTDSSGSGGGFYAVSGYDLVTGWGSPAGAALINQLAGVQSK